MRVKNVIGALAVTGLLATASPTVGLSQTTTQTKKAVSNCLSTEPLIKQMHDKIIMKKESYKKQEQGRTEELCQIMTLARKSYATEGVDFLIENGIRDLEDGSETSFTVLLALLDRDGITESGRDSKKLCMTDKNCMTLYKKMKRAFELYMLLKADEKTLKEAENKGK